MDVMFDRILSLRVSDVMTRDPVTVDASATMADVCHLFSGSKPPFGPGGGSTGRCVGIITASDFVQRTELCARLRTRRAARSGPDGVRTWMESDFTQRSYDSVSDCMTHGVQTVSRRRR